MSRLTPPTALIAVSITCAVLAACSKVIETSSFTETALGYGPTCHSALGAYYLPRKLLTLSVAAQQTKIEVTGALSAVTTADRAQAFCLDYLASPSSKDIVTVERSEKGLLASIHSNVQDRTPEIFGSLIDIGSNLAIAAGRESLIEGARPDDKLDLQFDPFDWDDLMTAKTALLRFGFCVYLEGHSFPIYGLDPTSVRAASERWCTTAQPTRPVAFADTFSTLPVPPEVMRLGILYRPNLAYRVVILRKRDPNGRGPWTLYQTKRVEMPNASPVLVIGIERAMFTTRQTTVKFNEGVLTDVAISKGSELEGFVGIPLKLAKAIVDVPAQIIQIRITDVQNQMALINAQGALIDALTKYRTLTAPTGPTASIPGRYAQTANTRSGEVYGACINGGGRPDECIAFLQSRR